MSYDQAINILIDVSAPAHMVQQALAIIGA